MFFLDFIESMSIMHPFG